MSQKIKKKKTRKMIWLVAESGHRRITSCSVKQETKLSLKKYDPTVKKHVLYIEKPYKSQ